MSNNTVKIAEKPHKTNTISGNEIMTTVYLSKKGSTFHIHTNFFTYKTFRNEEKAKAYFAENY